MKQDLTQYVEAALSGASINSQAKLAGVAQNTLQRLVIKHPGYAAAQAAGKLHKQGLPNIARVDAVVADAALEDVAGGMTLQAAALKHGLAVSTLTKIFHRRNPSTKLLRGGLGTPRNDTSRLERAVATVSRCKKALEKAEKELATLTAGQ
jgi:lambda repressor-like predicted transcriptional regulator